MEKLKVAIIGQGRSGRDIHAATLMKMQDKFILAAVVDSLEERRIKAINEFKCEAYGSYEELYGRNDLDLVINATPSHLHVPLTLDFLQRGFNVLCEKPLARTADEVDQLIKAAQKSGKLLSVFQQNRFSPAFMQVCNVIESGVLGRIVQATITMNGFSRRWDWQTLKKFNGGNLLNTGPHTIDQALQLYGTDVMPQVTCIMDSVNSFGDAEDYVKVILHGNDRPTIDVEISSCCSYPEYIYQVQGAYGGLKGNYNHLEWKYYDPQKAPFQQLIDTPLQKDDGSPVYCKEELVWSKGEWEHSDGDDVQDMFQVYYSNIYETLTKGAPLIVTPQHIRQQISVMDECFRQNPKFAK